MLERVSEQGGARVLVHFDLTGPTGNRPKNPDALQEAFLAFLGKLKPSSDGGRAPRVQRFSERPFLAVELDRRDLARLESRVEGFEFEGEAVRYRVELTPRLFGRATTAPAGDPVAVSTYVSQLGGGELTATGEGITIAVIDEGIDPDSGALAAPVVDASHVEEETAYCPAAVLTTDDPAAGKAPGASPYVPSHGTRVAGVATQVAGGVELISIRVGEGYGALVTDVAAALQELECRWRLEHPTLGAVVLAMTSVDVGGEDFESHRQLLLDAVVALQGEGIPVVVSAGNDELTGALAFPADLPPVVSVGSVEEDLATRSPSSNWSSALDLCAPGSKLGLPVAWSYDLYSCSGTSFSAPFVAGVIARMRQAFPACETEVIVRVLHETGTAIEVVEDGVVIRVPLIQIDLAAELLGATCGAAEEGFGAPPPTPGPWKAEAEEPPQRG